MLSALPAPLRRLPVLQPRDEDGEPRPRWHWAGFAAGLILAAWVPLAYASGLVLTSLAGGASGEPGANPWFPGLALAVSVGSLALAATGGGYVVGRYGPPRAWREAAAGAALVVSFGVALTWLRGPLAWEALAALLVGVPFAVLGARTGALRRVGSGSPPPR